MLGVSLDSFEYERRVDSAEGEIVAHDVIYVHFAAVTRDVVERGASRVYVVEVQVRAEERALVET